MEPVQVGEVVFQSRLVRHVYPYGNWWPWKRREYRRVPKGQYAVLVVVGFESPERPLDVKAAVRSLTWRQLHDLIASY